MDDLMKAIFRDAIDYIGRFVSERGVHGELHLAEQDGYKLLFGAMNKTLIADYKVNSFYLFVVCLLLFLICYFNRLLMHG